MREKQTLTTWMQGGLDYIMLQFLNVDGIRIIGSVLGQSIALDYYVRQVCFVQAWEFQLCRDFCYWVIQFVVLLLGRWNGRGIYRH